MDKRGYFYIIGAAVLWGTTGTAQALAPAGAKPLAVGALRLMVGGLALLFLFIAQKKRSGLGQVVHLKPSLVLLGAVCMAAYQVLFFAGVALTGVAVGTIVGIGSSPVLAGILGYLFRGERPGWRWGAATLLAVAGCSLLALTGREINVNVPGLLLAIGAGGAYATFSLASKGLLEPRPGFPNALQSEMVMAAVFSLGAVILSPLLLTQDLRWLAEPRGISVALWLGLCATALAYTLFGRGLQRTPLATAVTLSLGEPLTAAALGLLVLGEKLTLTAVLGIGLIFSGLVVLAIRPAGDRGAAPGDLPASGKSSGKYPDGYR